MSTGTKTIEQLTRELGKLRMQLEEANDTIHAIRTGQVDAFIVQGENGVQLYTLNSADHPYRVFIESMQEGAITLNDSGVVLYCNSRFAEKVGHPLETVIGMDFNTFLQSEEKPAFEKILKGDWGTKVRHELQLKNVSGELIPFLLSVSSMEMNEASFLNIILTDLSYIKESQRQLQLKDEFIGIASHELKTPLTSLKGYLQLMRSYKKDELPPIIRQFIAKANESGNKLNTLVEDLLDVSKINAGKLDFKVERVSIAALLGAVVENARLIYPDFIFSCSSEDSLVISGNPERLEQVLMNLISNSVKYNRANLNIDITAIKQGDAARISVSDHGIGLTDNQKELIFERFYRVEDKNYQASGLGIGLYISSEIIKAHGGNIGVESTFGVGSTFYFTLPLAG